AVRLARHLAERGHAVLRFDHAGVGDTPLRPDAQPFAQASLAEVGEAMDTLERELGVTRFALVGLCSGGGTAFAAAGHDPRVAAAVLITPQDAAEAGAADAPAAGEDLDQRVLNDGWARRYLRVSLLSRDAWWRAMTGRIAYRRLAGVLGRAILHRL